MQNLKPMFSLSLPGLRRSFLHLTLACDLSQASLVVSKPSVCPTGNQGHTSGYQNQSHHYLFVLFLSSLNPSTFDSTLYGVAFIL